MRPPAESRSSRPNSPSSPDVACSTNDLPASPACRHRGSEPESDSSLSSVAILNPAPTRNQTSSPGQRERTFEAQKQAWTTIFWPYADSSTDGRGHPSFNLWADGGCLAKFDQVLGKRGLPVGAVRHEKRPALGFLKPGADSPPGYYIPSNTVREDDAEQTTGVSFSGGDSLRPDVKKDFLDDFGNFGTNGKTNGTLDVSWWGSCDAVALAGITFREPLKPVTYHGVTFTPQDIKGLLVVCAYSVAPDSEVVGPRFNGLPDEVKLRDGNVLRGTIQNMRLRDFRQNHSRREKPGFITLYNPTQSIELKLVDGSLRKIDKMKIQSICREDPEALSPALFHKTLKTWLRDKRPFAMDYDPGPDVWNDNYDKAKVVRSSKPPADVKIESLNGHSGDYSGGAIRFYHTTLYQKGMASGSYHYWIEKKDNVVVNSGWLDKASYKSNPDFMWRPKDGANVNFSGDNKRNPFVLPRLVKEIYLSSLAPPSPNGES